MAYLSQTTTLEATAKIFEKNQWEKRHFVLKRSSFDNSGTLRIYKTSSHFRHSPAKNCKILNIDGVFGVESGFLLNNEKFTLAILCLGGVTILAFGSQLELNDWEWSIRSAFGVGCQYFVYALELPPIFSTICNTCVRLHVRDGRFCLVSDSPPRIHADFLFSEIRSFGPIENKFCVVAGSKTGPWTGVYVFRTGHCQQMAFTFKLASKHQLYQFLSSGDVIDGVNPLKPRLYRKRLCNDYDQGVKIPRPFAVKETQDVQDAHDSNLENISEKAASELDVIDQFEQSSINPVPSLVSRVVRACHRVRPIKIPVQSDSPYYSDTRPLMEKPTHSFPKPILKRSATILNPVNGDTNLVMTISSNEASKVLSNPVQVDDATSQDFITFSPPTTPISETPPVVLKGNILESDKLELIDNSTGPSADIMDVTFRLPPPPPAPLMRSFKSSLSRLDGHIFKFLPHHSHEKLHYADLDRLNTFESDNLLRSSSPSISVSNPTSISSVDTIGSGQTLVQYANIDSAATQAARKVISARDKTPHRATPTNSIFEKNDSLWKIMYKNLMASVRKN